MNENDYNGYQDGSDDDIEKYLSDIENTPLPAQEQISYLLKEGFIDCRYDPDTKKVSVFADPKEFLVIACKTLANTVVVTNVKTNKGFLVSDAELKKSSINRYIFD